MAKPAKTPEPTKNEIQSIARNKRARFDYEILGEHAAVLDRVTESAEQSVHQREYFPRRPMLLPKLLQALNDVAAGGFYLSPGVSGVVVDAVRSQSTTPFDELLSVRERQILKLIAEGYSTKECATILGVSAKTADSHRTRLMRKLDIHGTAGLVRYAVRHHFAEV